MKSCLLALPLLAFVAVGCKEKEDKEESGPILVLASMPEAYKLADGSYPVAKCIPLQLRTVDGNNQPVSMTDLDVSINAAASDSTEEKIQTPPAEADKVPVFGDSACKEAISGTTLRSVGGAINFATVYLLTSKPETLWLEVDYSMGMMRARFDFSSPMSNN